MKKLSDILNCSRDKSSNLESRELKQLLEVYNINLAKLGFPQIFRDNSGNVFAYTAFFKNVKIQPIKINDNLSAIVTGIYDVGIKSGCLDSGGNVYYPRDTYRFTIKDNKLNLRKKYL
jgi:hypothetical protein